MVGKCLKVAKLRCRLIDHVSDQALQFTARERRCGALVVWQADGLTSRSKAREARENGICHVHKNKFKALILRCDDTDLRTSMS